MHICTVRVLLIPGYSWHSSQHLQSRRYIHVEETECVKASAETLKIEPNIAHVSQLQNSQTEEKDINSPSMVSDAELRVSEI